MPNRIFSASTMIQALRSIFSRQVLQWPEKMVLRSVIIMVGTENSGAHSEIRFSGLLQVRYYLQRSCCEGVGIRCTTHTVVVRVRTTEAAARPIDGRRSGRGLVNVRSQRGPARCSSPRSGRLTITNLLHPPQRLSYTS